MPHRLMRLMGGANLCACLCGGRLLVSAQPLYFLSLIQK
ncbi:hypothetical protein TRIP_B250048 [uncultured Desulfatiglans sp.]|nr:hypothetical protein TRIP_B250048 [uncultured Desulfatiglans sp.]